MIDTDGWHYQDDPVADNEYVLNNRIMREREESSLGSAEKLKGRNRYGM